MNVKPLFVKRKAEIFDLDGVVIDSSHRYRTINHPTKGKVIDLQHWRANEKLCYLDTLLPHAEIYKQAQQDQQTLCIIATAREMKQPDFDFINKHLGAPDGMVYRALGDNSPGAKLKIEGIENVLKYYNFKDNNKMTVYEDNINYLKEIANHFNCNGQFVPSTQGH